MIKKILTLVALTVCVQVSPVFAQNLLTNADFENGIINNWNQFGPNWAAQNQVVFEGSISAQNTIGTIPDNDYFASLSQSVTASAGQKFYATLQVKTDINVQAFARAGVIVQFKNANNVVLGTVYQDEIGGQTDWRNLYVETANAPAGTATVEFLCFVFASQSESQNGGVAFNGKAYFDDAVLQTSPIAPPPPNQDLVNPGYENGYVDWELIFPPAYVLTNASATQGTYSAQATIGNTAGQDFFASSFQDIEYLGGPVWASADIKTNINPLSPAVGGLLLEFYNTFDPAPEDCTTPTGPCLGFAQAVLSGNNGWTQAIVDGGGSGVTPPAGTVMIRVHNFVFAAQGDNNAVGGVVGFDNNDFSYTPITNAKNIDLENAGFENGLQDWNDLFGFPATVDTNSFSGSLAAKKSVGVTPGQDYYSQLYQDVYFDANGSPFPIGTPVYATAYVESDFDPLQLVKSRAGLQMEFIDANGATIGGSTPIVLTDSITGQTPYRYLYIDTDEIGGTPAGTERVRISGFEFAREQDAAAGGDAYYDDFDYSITTPLNPPAPKTNLENRGFENGYQGWTEENKPGELTNVLANVHNGNLATEYTVDDEVLIPGNDYYATVSQEVSIASLPFSSFRRYVSASGWVKTAISPVTPAVAGIQLDFIDANGQLIAPSYSQSIGGNNPYTKLEIINQVIPAGAEKVRFSFFFFAPKFASIPGNKAYFDDGTLKIKPFISTWTYQVGPAQLCPITGPCP